MKVNKHQFHQSSLLALCCLSCLTKADIVTDGSLGEAASLAGPDYQISQDLGQTRGSNLFHSFSQFDLQHNESATFSGDNQVNNIFARVTGAEPSHLDGMLRSTISDANLYLINPRGVVMGPNMRIDIQGSFYVTTAHELVFSEGERFFANVDDESQLSVAPLKAFGFSSSDVAAIRIEGTRLIAFDSENYQSLVDNAIAEGELGEGSTHFPGDHASQIDGNITLVGGDIIIENAHLQAAETRVNEIADPDQFAHSYFDLNKTNITMLALASAGELPVDNFAAAEDLFATLADINISENTAIDSGGQFFIRARNLLIEDGRLSHNKHDSVDQLFSVDIGVEALSVIYRKSYDDSIFNHGSGIFAINYGIGAMGDMRISADKIEVQGDLVNLIFDKPDLPHTQFDPLRRRSAILVAVKFSEGDTGDIVINTDRLLMDNGAYIENVNVFGGDFGGIVINSGTISLATNSIVQGLADAPQESIGRDINIVTDELLMSGAQIRNVSNIGPATASIDISASLMQLEESSLIFKETGGTVSNLNSSAGGGGIRLDAEMLTLGGQSNIHLSSLGVTGEIYINAADIELVEGAQIYNGSWGSADFTNNTTANGGVTIETQSLILRDDSSIVSRYVFGNSGGLQIDANSMTITGEAQLLSEGVGDLNLVDLQQRSGDIDVNVWTLSLADSGSIHTRHFYGASGNINLGAQSISVNDAALIRTAAHGYGDSGDINIQTQELTIDDNNVESVAVMGLDTGNLETKADTIDQLVELFFMDAQRLQADFLAARENGFGNAGDIDIVADTVVLRGGGTITTGLNVGSGSAGDISIVANRFEASGVNEFIESSWGVYHGAGVYSFSQSTSGESSTGQISLNVMDAVLTSGGVLSTASFIDADAGNIVVNASNSLDMSDQGRIVSAALVGGDAGDIEISTDILTIGGVSDNAFFATGIASLTEPGAGEGGDIAITARQLSIADGAQISSITRGDGDGGDIHIVSDRLEVFGGSSLDGLATAIDASAGFYDNDLANAFRLAQFLPPIDQAVVDGATGDGGDIYIKARQISLGDGASIQANSYNFGLAGDINIDSEFLTLQDAAIATQAASSDGGNILLNISERLTASNSVMTTSVSSGEGDGGNIRTSADSVLLMNSKLKANAHGGNGGNVKLVTPLYIADNRSALTASSALGLSGIVEIKAPDEINDDALARLPESTGKVAEKFSNHCNKQRWYSSFTVQGKNQNSLYKRGLLSSRYPSVLTKDEGAGNLTSNSDGQQTSSNAGAQLRRSCANS